MQGAWMRHLRGIITKSDFFIEHAYNILMQYYTDKLMNCVVGDNGNIHCFWEIITLEDLQSFYYDVIEPELIHQMDDYLKSDYKLWVEDKIEHLPTHLRSRLSSSDFSNSTMEEMHDYLEDVGYSRISDLPLPINEMTVMIGDEIHKVSILLKFHTITTKNYLDYDTDCEGFRERMMDIMDRVLPSRYEYDKVRIEIAGLSELHQGA